MTFMAVERRRRCVCVCVCVRVSMYVCVCVCMYVYVYAYMYLCSCVASHMPHIYTAIIHIIFLIFFICLLMASIYIATGTFKLFPYFPKSPSCCTVTIARLCDLICKKPFPCTCGLLDSAHCWQCLSIAAC